jgi:Zn-dependent protease
VRRRKNGKNRALLWVVGGALSPLSQVIMPHFLRAWKLGRAFGIPLYVHPTFVLLLPLVLLLHGVQDWGSALFLLVLVPAVFGCVLLHELGHALTARRFGIGTRDITLYPIGGVARLERMSEEPVQELLIALAGPAVNVAIVLLLAPLFVLLAAAGGLQGDGPLTLAPGWLGLLTGFVGSLAGANLVLVVFNLLPVFPMDGGRVLRSLLAMGLGLMRATEVAAFVGLVLAGGLGILALFVGNPMLLLVVLFMGWAGQQELLMLRRREAVRREAALAAAVQPIAPGGPPAPVLPVYGYTGFTFDHDRRLWVWWQDGRPVAVHWHPPE